MGRKDKFYVIALNLLREKHQVLIEQIKKEASESERSMSSLCISILKKYFAEKER